MAAYVVVYLQATFDGVRSLLGTQVDLLPSLIVYASLSCTLTQVALVAFLGGLMFDSLSANPLGVSMLPLFVIGFIIQQYRGLILRDQRYAQFMLGLGASAGAPLITLLVLVNTDAPPLIGWFSLWQLAVMAVAGAVVTPLWFMLFDRALGALSYRPWETEAFRRDREIKRGRM